MREFLCRRLIKLGTSDAFRINMDPFTPIKNDDWFTQCLPF